MFSQASHIKAKVDFELLRVRLRVNVFKNNNDHSNDNADYDLYQDEDTCSVRDGQERTLGTRLSNYLPKWSPDTDLEPYSR